MDRDIYQRKTRDDFERLGWPLLTFALALPTAAALADLLTGGHVFELPPVVTLGLVALVGVGAYKTDLLGRGE